MKKENSLKGRLNSLQHRQIHENGGNYKCPVCDKGFQFLKYLRKHPKIKEKEEVKCSDCEKIFI